MKHVLLWADDSEPDLVSELGSVLPVAHWIRNPAALLEADFSIPGNQCLPQIAFARQFLPFARPVSASSIRDWAVLLTDAIRDALPGELPWMLHVEPHYGETGAHRIGARAWHSIKKFSSPGVPLQETREVIDSAAGRRRCDLIRESATDLLRKSRRYLLKRLRKEPVNFTAEDSMVQLLLTSPETGFFSIAHAPFPLNNAHLISPFPLGRVRIPSDPAAPSRAFAKLLEAEARLGCAIKAENTCVDLGAAPGSWTYAAVQRGASVTAVDRSLLRDDLMRHKSVSFVARDAFGFQPSRPVDWLLCDVIAEPARSGALLLEWLRHGWCRHFVVTLKLKGGPALDTLAELRTAIPTFSKNWHMKKLCANKKEVCVFGTIDTKSGEPLALRN